MNRSKRYASRSVRRLRRMRTVQSILTVAVVIGCAAIYATTVKFPIGALMLWSILAYVVSAMVISANVQRILSLTIQIRVAEEVDYIIGLNRQMVAGAYD